MKMNRGKMKRLQKEQKKYERQAAAIESPKPPKQNKLWILSYVFVPFAFPTWVIYSLWMKFVYRGSGINRNVSLLSLVEPDVLRFHFAAVLQGFFTWYFFYDVIPFQRMASHIRIFFHYLIGVH